MREAVSINLTGIRMLVLLSQIAIFGGLAGCIVENRSARESESDMSIVQIDGGTQCDNVCSSDGCAGGEVYLDESCRCVCQVACENVECMPCAAGEETVVQPGECCPVCLNGCQDDFDCAESESCNGGLCGQDCSLLDCAQCPEGYITGLNPGSCCDCTPACGPGSPFTCSEGQTCYDGFCKDDEIDCTLIPCEACPPGTEAVQSDKCCPECQPVGCDCPAIYQPVCAEGQTFNNPCRAECAGFDSFTVGACGGNVCDVDGDCDATCSAVMRCFEAECESILQADILRNGCEDECGGGAGLNQLLCNFESCGELVEAVLDLTQINFCAPNSACENTPENVLYVAFGQECEEIDYDCPPDADYYRDDCGCGCVFGELDCSNPPPGVTYVAQGEECERIRFECGADEDYIFDQCGCGCEQRDCGCPDFDAPVCGPDGTIYRNDCEATCVGVFGARSCEMACECPDIYEPVCGLDAQTYSSTCHAECLSMPVVHSGACFETDLCPDGFETNCLESCMVAANCFEEFCDISESEQIREECAQFCEEGAPLAEVICSASTCEELVLTLGPITGRDDVCSIQGDPCPDRNVADYLAYDSESCELFEFTCEEGTEPFSNRCGCGCAPAVACPQEGRDARYISRDADICERITLDCPENSQAFSDDCGCGCLY